jgi:hypothetical protein
MGLFRRSSGGSSESCARCGRPMALVNYIRVGTPEDFLNQTQGCFQCQSCGRLTCYDCSDSRQPCECGTKNWFERTYLAHGYSSMKSLQSRYEKLQTRLMERANQELSAADAETTRAATLLIERFNVLQKKRSASDYMDVASYLLSNYSPVLAYFIATELDEKLEPRLGYPPVGQILLAMEILGNENSARWIATALRNFPRVETAKLAFSVIKSPAMRALVRADIAAEDTELAEFICFDSITPPPNPAPTSRETTLRTEFDHNSSLSDGIERMPRHLTEAEQRGDRLFLHLQIVSKMLFLLFPVLGVVLRGWVGAILGLAVGLLVWFGMRHSMGLRGLDPNDGWFIRMKERANGARRGILEALIERVRQRCFTPEQCVAITKAWEDTRRQLEAAKSEDEKRKLLNALDAEVKRVSYGEDG